jgi:hypothetical protein
VKPVNMRILIRLTVAALLGVAAAALVSCASTGKGLIPSSDAGPLQSDFESVSRAAETGEGSCAETESALGKTEQDFLKLPTSVDRGLRSRLQLGIENLRKQALTMCEQAAEAKTTGTQTSTTSTTTSTNTETTPPTQSTPTTTGTTSTPTTTTPPSESGGTEASEAEEGASKGKGLGKGEGEGSGKVESESNAGAGVGGASPGGGQ